MCPVLPQTRAQFIKQPRKASHNSQLENVESLAVAAVQATPEQMAEVHLHVQASVDAYGVTQRNFHVQLFLLLSFSILWRVSV